MANRLWTDEEIKYLIDNWTSFPASHFSKKFNRSAETVRARIYLLKKAEIISNETHLKSLQREWTDDEIVYLERAWLRTPTENIAKHLNRTKSSVRHKARKMKLYTYGDDGEITKYILCNIFHCSYHKIDVWMQEGLPCQKTKIDKRNPIKISITKFWKWAKSHKNLIDWDKYEIGSLLPEPAFVAVEKRKRIDYNNEIKSKHLINEMKLFNSFQCDYKVIQRWFNSFGLPCEKIIHGKRCYYQISVTDFWKWAEKNKTIIHWENYVRKSLLPEPRFLNEIYDENNKVIINQQLTIKNNTIDQSNLKKVFNCSKGIVKSWCNMGLPYEVIPIGEIHQNRILITDFWQWADTHRNLIPWENYEYNTLAPDPEFVKEEKRNTIEVLKQITMQDLTQAFHCNRSRILKWINEFDLLFTKLKRGRNWNYYFNREQFWSWVEIHQDIVPWKNYKAGSLKPEPPFIKNVLKKE